MSRLRRAFTLIELIAAMAIGVLLLSVIVQTFRSIAHSWGSPNNPGCPRNDGFEGVE